MSEALNAPVPCFRLGSEALPLGRDECRRASRDRFAPGDEQALQRRSATTAQSISSSGSPPTWPGAACARACRAAARLRSTSWSEPVKGLWDANRRHGHRLQVVLLTSVPLAAQTETGDRLAGRYQNIPVNHRSFAEMAAACDFDVASYIGFGAIRGRRRLSATSTAGRAMLSAGRSECRTRHPVDAAGRQAGVGQAAVRTWHRCIPGSPSPSTRIPGQPRDAGSKTTLAPNGPAGEVRLACGSLPDDLRCQGTLRGSAAWAGSPRGSRRTRPGTPRSDSTRMSAPPPGPGFRPC